MRHTYELFLQLRMDNTTVGADMGGGTAGLLGFSQKMTQSDENFSAADVATIKTGNGCVLIDF